MGLKGNQLPAAGAWKQRGEERGPSGSRVAKKVAVETGGEDDLTFSPSLRVLGMEEAELVEGAGRGMWCRGCGECVVCSMEQSM